MKDAPRVIWARARMGFAGRNVGPLYQRTRSSNQDARVFRTAAHFDRRVPFTRIENDVGHRKDGWRSNSVDVMSRPREIHVRGKRQKESMDPSPGSREIEAMVSRDGGGRGVGLSENGRRGPLHSMSVRYVQSMRYDHYGSTVFRAYESRGGRLSHALVRILVVYAKENDASRRRGAATRTLEDGWVDLDSGKRVCDLQVETRTHRGLSGLEGGIERLDRSVVSQREHARNGSDSVRQTRLLERAMERFPSASDRGVRTKRSGFQRMGGVQHPNGQGDSKLVRSVPEDAGFDPVQYYDGEPSRRISQPLVSRRPIVFGIGHITGWLASEAIDFDLVDIMQDVPSPLDISRFPPDP